MLGSRWVYSYNANTSCCSLLREASFGGSQWCASTGSRSCRLCSFIAPAFSYMSLAFYLQFTIYMSLSCLVRLWLQSVASSAATYLSDNICPEKLCTGLASAHGACSCRPPLCQLAPPVRWGFALRPGPPVNYFPVMPHSTWLRNWRTASTLAPYFGSRRSSPAN